MSAFTYGKNYAIMLMDIDIDIVLDKSKFKEIIIWLKLNI